MKIFISPHDDDHALFGAYTCMRDKPVVVIVLDSYIQPNRGEVGCSAEERALETKKSCDLLGCEVKRLGLRDDITTEEDIEVVLKTLTDVDDIYIPALQGGNKHHDMVHRVAIKLFPNAKIYPTYTKTELYTTGETEIVPTKEEKELKTRALAVYQSQIRINGPHFVAVVGKSEWLGVAKMVYLGAGSDRKEGWIHLDAFPFPGIDVVCDVRKGLPFEDNSIAHIYSQDFLEHTPPETKVELMNEIWRVLRPGGIMEHVVPMAGSDNDFGSPSHISHWHPQQFEHFDVDSYRYEKDRYYEGFKGGFRKVFVEVAENGQTFHVKYTKV